MKTEILLLFAICAGICATGQAVDYKKNVISGGSNNVSSSTSFSYSGGAPGMSPFPSPMFGSTFRGTSLDDRITEAERNLAKLVFIRDVCPKLENEVALKCTKMDIRKVIDLVSSALNAPVPYEVPTGEYLVEECDVAGMPADQFIETIAIVAKLRVEYAKDKIVFHEIPEEK